MPHQIDIEIPNNYRLIVQSVIDKATEHNVHVWLSSNRLVPVNDGSQCNGFFEDEPKPKLAVACGQDPQKWIQILLHESSHMDQWIEKSPYWTNGKFCGIEAINVIELWIRRYIEFQDDKKWKIVRAARNVELDCERRTAIKIANLDIGINPEQYTVRANAYVLFYNIIGLHRRWYTPGREPYNIPEIYNAMPTVFHDDAWYEPINMSMPILTTLMKCL